VARLATTGIGSATVSTEPESFAVGERGGRLFLLKLVTP
jgi:hypothetical protein